MSCLGLGPQGGILYEYTGGYDVIELVSVERNIEFLTVEEVYPPKPTEPPRPAQPTQVEGWTWSDMYVRWEETPMLKEFRWVTADTMRWPPKPLIRSPALEDSERWGWRFDYDVMRWKTIPMQVEVLKERPPEPTYIPQAAGPSEVEGWRYNFTALAWESVGMIEKESVQLVDLMCWRQRSTGFLVWALADYVGFATQVGANRFRVF